MNQSYFAYYNLRVADNHHSLVDLDRNGLKADFIFNDKIAAAYALMDGTPAYHGSYSDKLNFFLRFNPYDFHKDKTVGLMPAHIGIG